MEADELVSETVGPQVHLHGLIRTDLAVKVNGEAPGRMSGHRLRAQGVAQPVRLLRVVHMAVRVQIRVLRAVRDDLFRSLHPVDSPGKGHGLRQIAVIRQRHRQPVR